MKNAPSTVGLSAYNILASNGSPMQATRLLKVVQGGLNDDTITQDEFVLILTKMVELNRLRIHDREKGLVDITDSKRRIVRQRDRTGDGWNGWMLDSKSGLKTAEGAL